MTEENTNLTPEASAPAAADAKGSSEPKKEVSKETQAPAAPKAASAEVPAKFKKIVEEIESMSVVDLNALVKVFEEKFGVSATAVAAAPAAGGAGDAGEGKSIFTVKLTDSGAQKIAVIKVVKEVLALGLKEAKDLVDGVPSVLKENVKKDEAEAMKKKIEAAGGKVELA